MRVLQGTLTNAGPEDAVLVYFAGHGISRSTFQGELGYLIPYDGSLKADEMYKNISMQQIRSDVSPLIPAKHVLFVIDACFGGLLLEKRAAGIEPSRERAYLAEITREPARQIITAGGKGQQVLDRGIDGHSVFTGRLIQDLRENRDFVTARELGLKLQRQVFGDAQARGHDQRPLFGEIYGTGDFVFVVANPGTVASENAPAAGSVPPAGSGSVSGAGGEYTNGLGMRFVKIPAGSFLMGSPASMPGRPGGEAQHRVTISRPFCLQATEVTQGQWEAVMGENPSRFKDCGKGCPVEGVSWFDAVRFCNKASEREGLRAAYRIQGEDVTWDREADGYRLPTEAEWEYAARAGTGTPFSFGACLSTDEANFDGNYPLAGCPKGSCRERPVEAGSLGRNAWGLYDMHGNVWEWCWDRYGEYPPGSAIDPVGPSSGAYRVERGGSWASWAGDCGSADRGNFPPGRQVSSGGLRLARAAGRPL